MSRFRPGDLVRVHVDDARLAERATISYAWFVFARWHGCLGVVLDGRSLPGRVGIWIRGDHVHLLEDELVPVVAP